MCKTGQSFIKKTRKETIFLSEVSSPKISFLLQNNDTLKFANKDVCSEIEYSIKREIKSVGYLVSKDLANISQMLSTNYLDTLVYQNLSAVDIKT